MSVYTNDNVSYDRGMMMVLWMMIRDIQSRFVFATRSANGQTIRNDIPLASVPSTAQQNTHNTRRHDDKDREEEEWYDMVSRAIDSLERGKL